VKRAFSSKDFLINISSSPDLLRDAIDETSADREIIVARSELHVVEWLWAYRNAVLEGKRSKRMHIKSRMWIHCHVACRICSGLDDMSAVSFEC